MSKEKAIELVTKMFNAQTTPASWHRAKECAIIAVDEVLSINKEIWDDFHEGYFEKWQQVKQEIKKL